MSQKLDARPAVPRVDDAAERLLSRNAGPSPEARQVQAEGVRLDLCEEGLNLSIDVSKVARLASIARAVVAEVLRQKSKTESDDKHTCLRLLKEQERDLEFIIDHLEEAARDADKSFEAFENVLVDHLVVKRSDGGEA